MSNKGFSEESLRRIAAQKVSFRRTVKLHWSLYIIVNFLLFIINIISINFSKGFNDIFALNYEILPKLWVIYVIFGWLIGVLIHTVTYIMYATGVYPYAKRGVIFNITAYFTVMLLLTGINYLTMPQFWWAFYPAVFWGVGIIIHIIVYILFFRTKITSEGKIKSKKEIAIEKEIAKMKEKMEK
ncbi:MAG: 2TM domain-containing protein [Promethearchaeia archaeon]